MMPPRVMALTSIPCALVNVKASTAWPPGRVPKDERVIAAVREGAGAWVDEEAGASVEEELQAPPSVAASSNGSKDSCGRRRDADIGWLLKRRHVITAGHRVPATGHG